MSIRDLYSNNSIYPDFGYPVGGQWQSGILDEGSFTGEILNLSKATTATWLTTVYPLNPAAVGSVNLPLTVQYGNDFTVDGSGNTNSFDVLFTETFDAVTGVSELGNQLMMFDGSPILNSTVTGDETTNNDFIFNLVNPPGTYKYVRIVTGEGTSTLNTMFGAFWYRGPQRFVGAGVPITYRRNNF